MSLQQILNQHQAEIEPSDNDTLAVVDFQGNFIGTLYLRAGRLVVNDTIHDIEVEFLSIH